MRKEIKIYSAVIILSMLAFIYMACIQRASWHEVIINQELLDGYQIMNSVDFTTKQAAPSLSELVGESQIIVEVEGTDNHEELEYTILSEVRVKKVYKGDDLLVDKVIFIYELFYINNNNSYVISDGGYMLMQPNTSYILFLNFYEKPEGYKYTEKLTCYQKCILANIPLLLSKIRNYMIQILKLMITSYTNKLRDMIF